MERGNPGVGPLQPREYNPENWNDPSREWRKSCGGCHTTGYDAEAKTFVEVAIGCEACHGPGSEHVAGGGDKTKIVRTYDAQVCGQCHIRGKDSTGQYSYPIAYVPDGEASLADVFVETTAEKDMWPDGHEKSHHQQYMGWERSGHAHALETLKASDHAQDFCAPCHSADARLEGLPLAEAQYPITCVTCHSPHSPDPEMLRDEAYDLCVSCHNGTSGGTRPIEAGAEVHHPMQEMFEGRAALGVEGTPSPHFAAEGGPVCSSCHLTKTAKSATTGDVASHNTAIVMPGEAAEGEPDSCSGCHADMDKAALQGLIDQRQGEISSLMEQLQAALDAAADKESDAYKTAYTNLTFVHSDGSMGMHNYAYAKAILESSLQLVSAAPEAMAPAELPTTGGDIPSTVGWVVTAALAALSGGAGLLYTRRRKR